jgi:predicted DsbA family dithiol-disulfide isomerase
MPAEQWRSGMSPAAREVLWERIGAMGAAVGLEMKSPRILANSMPALQASEFAAEAGAAEAFEDRVFRAYFSEGINIGERDALLDLGAEVGLDRTALGEALDSGKYTMRVKNNAMSATQKGISGVPTLLIGDWPLVGAQSEDVMRRVLQRATELADAGK